MIVKVFRDKVALSRAAANHAAASLRGALLEHPWARILVAAGTSQLEFLENLTQTSGIDWHRVEMFHLDEYIGLPISHSASFRNILTERLIQKVGITNYYFLDGDTNPSEAIRSVGSALAASPVHVAFLGIGENAHLAFNDPPADFETDVPYLIVSLDEACRRQQVGEGWFANLADVPKQAITISIRQILKAEEILVVVPDSRKASAVQACLEGEISPLAPASILRTHRKTTLYLDQHSAGLLTRVATINY
jgi:glucosamine-6-phosphate deaminase